MTIRIENPKTAKFVAERILQFAQKHGEKVTDDIEGNHVFVGWKLGKLFVCVGSDFGEKSITAYFDDGPDGKLNDLLDCSLLERKIS